MGIGDFFSGIKGKVKDKVTETFLEKAIENMRDLKIPVKESSVNELLEKCLWGKGGIKKASVDLSRDGVAVKVTFEDGREAVKRTLEFEKMIWTPQKKAFNFRCGDEPVQWEVYACIAVTLGCIARQVLGFNEKKCPYKDDFSCEVGPLAEGMLQREGIANFDMRRVPFLRQYYYFKVMGQSPLEHLNLVDCWLEGGKFIVRMDNNAVVDKLKGMNPEQLKAAMQGMQLDEKDLQEEQE